jgi:uncharacterized membrane protein
VDSDGYPREGVSEDFSRNSGGLKQLAGENFGPETFDREKTCLNHGDCSDGRAEMTSKDCEAKGDCLDVASKVVTKAVRPSDCLAGHDAGTKVYSPYVLSIYAWENFDSAEAFICQPKAMATSPQVNDYPPKDMSTALLNRWVSSDGPCWMPVLKSTDVLFRCVPQMLEDVVQKQLAADQAADQATAQYFFDIRDYWYLIPMGAVFGLILAFIWINFLAKFAGFLIWSTVVLIELLLPALGILCLYKAGVVPAPMNIPPAIQKAMAEVQYPASQVPCVGLVW